MSNTEKMDGYPSIPKGFRYVSVLVLLEGESSYSEALYGTDGCFRFGYDEPVIENVESWMELPKRNHRAQQHHGEPVGIAATELKLHTYAGESGYTVAAFRADVVPDGTKLYTLESLGSGLADPGEIEKANKLAETAADQVVKLLAQLRDANDKLAERDAQLRHREQMLEKVAGGWPLRVYTEEDPLLIKNCGELLAYSVEDGVMVTFDPDRMEPWIGAKPVNPFTNITVVNNGLGYYVGGAASAEPSAPIEIDERAEFENHYRDKIMGNRTGVRFLRSRSGVYLDSEVREMWSGWKARAALERKP